MTEQLRTWREDELETIVSETFDVVARAITRHRAKLHTEERGRVTRLAGAVADVEGFTTLTDQELIEFPDGLIGIAMGLHVRRAGVVLLGPAGGLRQGDEARRTGRVVDIPVGKGLLGRVIDAAGRSLDDRGSIETSTRLPVERAAPAIIDRGPVATPLQTGIKAIDAAIPIGRGQRELIIGDRQTGKTAIAVDAILNQRDTGVVSVYCAIGQRGAAVARVVDTLRRYGALDRTVVVVAAGEDPPGLQFVAPYAATSIAESFMEQGQDVLIVYDDLTRHARAYRELSLLLRRPPGREAYPGDIFYIHSRLLERSTKLRDEKGGGSLTALPVIETQAQNISAYIPTNLISITDGQIYLSPELFRKGHLPAVDVGKSVSRVGGKAQLPAFRAVAGDLRLSYSQFEELESFARFGAQMDEDTRQDLERGRRVREILKQNEHDLFGVVEQIATLLAATRGLLDSVPPERISEAEQRLRETARDRLEEIGGRIREGGRLDEQMRETILDAAREALSSFAEPDQKGEEEAD